MAFLRPLGGAHGHLVQLQSIGSPTMSMVRIAPLDAILSMERITTSNLGREQIVMNDIPRAFFGHEGAST
jgi:hypothetical protein